METIFMRSPDGEVKEVEATTEALTPRYSDPLIIPTESRACGPPERAPDASPAIVGATTFPQSPPLP